MAVFLILRAQMEILDTVIRIFIQREYYCLFFHLPYIYVNVLSALTYYLWHQIDQYPQSTDYQNILPKIIVLLHSNIACHNLVWAFHWNMGCLLERILLIQSTLYYTGHL